MTRRFSCGTRSRPSSTRCSKRFCSSSSSSSFFCKPGARRSFRSPPCRFRSSARLRVMLAFGFTINKLSLFGLVLAIGIVVDDAIVVVENVERNIALRLVAVRRRAAGDERSDRPDHRDGAGAVRGVRADGVHQRLDRPVLQAIRASPSRFRPSFPRSIR